MRARAHILCPAAVAAIVAGWGLGAPSLWRDEATTQMVAQWGPRELYRLILHTDAVHLAYYLLVHPIVAIAGPNEISLRLLSVAATAVAAGGLAMIGARLFDHRVGLFAGLLFAVSPTVVRYAQEARPYALTVALVVVATCLLLRHVEERRTTTGLAYGVSIAAVGAANLFGLIVCAVHGLAVAARGLRRVPGWAIATVLGVTPLAGLLYLAAGQRDAVSWIPRPDAGTLVALADQMGGGGLLSAAMWCLAVAGVAIAVRARATKALSLLLPWIVVPPAVLLAVSVFAQPVYVFRYVLYCVPALCLLAACALAALTPWARVGVLAAVVALGVPAHLAIRGPAGHEEDLRAAAAVVSAQARAGDGVMFSSMAWRRVVAAYPDSYAVTTDVALDRTPRETGRLSGREVSPTAVRQRLQGVRRVWLIGAPGSLGPVASELRAHPCRFRRDRDWPVAGVAVSRYVATARCAPPAP